MDDGLAALLTIGLGGWRLAYLLVYEEGPFGVIAGLRRAAGVPLSGEARGLLPTLLSCVFCLSFWTVLAVTALYALEPWLAIPLAAWGVATLAHRFVAG